MEIIFKCTAAAVLCAAACLVIKKSNPEFAYVLAVFVAASILLSVSAKFSGFKELIKTSEEMLGNTSLLLSPVLKCIAVGFITKFGADICKDASQTAIASAIEFGGVLCAAGTAFPVILKTIKMLGTII